MFYNKVTKKFIPFLLDTESEYRKYPAVNQSDMNKMREDMFEYYKYKTDKTPLNTPAIRIGGAVDTILTGSMEEFEKSYTVLDVPDLTPHQISLCDAVIAIKKENPFIDNDTLAEQAHERSTYTWKASRSKKVLFSPNCQNYLKVMQKAKDTIVLSVSEKEVVDNCVNNIMSWDHSKIYFPHLCNMEDNNIEVKYQIPIVFQYKMVECKALFDIIIIDHSNETIYPVDLKTSANADEFGKSFLKWGYYIQAAFYSEALRQYISEGDVDERIKNYKIENFKFVVVGKKPHSVPRIYECTDEDLKAGKEGAYTKKFNKYFPGFSDLIGQYLWHEQQNYWKTSKFDFENNFTKKLDIF